MKIELATKQYVKQIVSFFEEYLDESNEAITGREFFCPFGVKAAVQRKQVIIVLENEKIVAALRFYPRKRDNIVSIYQFAIDENNRWKDLLKKMLIKTGYKTFEVICPLDSVFNEYYKKTNWTLKTKNEEYNYWNLVFE